MLFDEHVLTVRVQDTELSLVKGPYPPSEKRLLLCIKRYARLRPVPREELAQSYCAIFFNRVFLKIYVTVEEHVRWR